MVAELAPVTLLPIGLIYPMKEELDKITGQYFSFEELTLTEDFSFTLPFGDQKFKNMIVRSSAMWEGTDAPTIAVSYKWYNPAGTSLGSYYGTPRFEIGAKGHYAEKSFRVAPWMPKCDNVFKVTITVPSGTTLHIKYLANNYDDTVSRQACDFNLNAHGYCGISGPVNTLATFEKAAKLGYKYCITIPKVTSDDVLVCFHDDSDIQNQARNDDGTTIDSQYQNIPISGFTYEQLLQFDFGIYRGQPFKGQRIPLLADFFKICARTGMHPMLSVHPSLTGYWDDIKAMAEKYGVLHQLNIKSDNINIEVPMAVLLDEVESYTIDDSVGASRVARFDSLCTTYNIVKAKKVIEYEYSVITDELITEALTGGYRVGCYNEGYDMNVIESLIEKGVTEIVDDYIASVGLNW